MKKAIRPAIFKWRQTAEATICARSDPDLGGSTTPDQPLNLDRMRAATAGGTWRNWDDNLISPCHKAATGNGYASVYGRIEWNTPSPTITTQFFGFGNGRFGHLAGEAGSQPVTRLLPIGKAEKELEAS